MLGGGRLALWGVGGRSGGFLVDYTKRSVRPRPGLFFLWFRSICFDFCEFGCSMFLDLEINEVDLEIDHQVTPVGRFALILLICF